MSFEFEPLELSPCESDVASRTENFMLLEALKAQKARASAQLPLPRKDGTCLWCEESLTKPPIAGAFCSVDCATDHTKHSRLSLGTP